MVDSPAYAGLLGQSSPICQGTKHSVQAPGNTRKHRREEDPKHHQVLTLNKAFHSKWSPTTLQNDPHPLCRGWLLQQPGDTSRQTMRERGRCLVLYSPATFCHGVTNCCPANAGKQHSDLLRLHTSSSSACVCRIELWALHLSLLMLLWQSQYNYKTWNVVRKQSHALCCVPDVLITAQTEPWS